MINKRGIVEVMAALLVHVYPLSVHLVPPMTVCSVTIGSPIPGILNDPLAVSRIVTQRLSQVGESNLRHGVIEPFLLARLIHYSTPPRFVYNSYET